MFGMGAVGLIFMAIAISIVVKSFTRAATEIQRRRDPGPAVDGASRERIEALEDRLRMLEERQDFTDDLLSGRRERRLAPADEAPSGRSDPGDTPPPSGEGRTPAADA